MRIHACFEMFSKRPVITRPPLQGSSMVSNGGVRIAIDQHITLQPVSSHPAGITILQHNVKSSTTMTSAARKSCPGEFGLDKLKLTSRVLSSESLISEPRRESERASDLAWTEAASSEGWKKRESMWRGTWQFVDARVAFCSCSQIIPESRDPD